jgi:uncharacterized protein (TIGR03086 family)
MTIDDDLRPLHRRALAAAGEVIAAVSPADLGRATPCAGWTLRDLLGHLFGQNHGFARAVEVPDTPASAYADRTPAPADPPDPLDPAGVMAGWRTSADRVAAAFAAAVLDRPVLLAEVSAEVRFPAGTVVGFHLLDTVVHTWDVAASLGQAHLPDGDLVAATLDQARRIPDGPARLRPGAAFAPALPPSGPGFGADPAGDWGVALAMLGRSLPSS